MIHIIERGALHLICSSALTLSFFFAMGYWRRKNKKAAAWLPEPWQQLLLFSGILVFSLMTLREPFDVYFGTQVWYKAITDQLSWLLGAGLSVWGLYRFKTMKG